MKKNATRLLAAASATALLLSGCTSNTGVATSETDSTEASQTVLEYSVETMDMSGMSVYTVYGSQLPQYLNHQYYFNGEAVSLTESNFYFIDTFSDLTAYAGYYYPSTSEGFIDLSAEITTSDADTESEYETYGDFFVSYAEQMLESSCIINLLAEQEGLELSEDTIAEIDSVMENLQTQGADPAGITVDEYLSIYYGEGTTAESFRETVERYYIADLYTQEYIDNYEFDDSEIMVPNIRYTLYSVSSDATAEELAAAEESAQALMEEADGSLDSYAVAGALAYTNGEATQYGEIAVPDDGTIDAVFTEWAWDESREVGDIDVIYSENFGYFVVGYVGLTEVDDSSKQQIAVNHLSEVISEMIDNDTYEFYTNDEYLPAEAVPEAEETESEDLTSTDVVATAEETSAGSLTGNKALDVVLIIFAVVGVIAVAGLVAIGIMHVTGKKKTEETLEKKETPETKEAPEQEEETPDGSN